MLSSPNKFFSNTRSTTNDIRAVDVLAGGRERPLAQSLRHDVDVL